LPALEDDRLVAVSDDAVLTVPQHRPRQNKALDIGAEAYQVFHPVAVVNPHHVLFDDRAVVEVLPVT